MVAPACRAGMRQLLEEKMNELVLFINSLMRDSTINPFRYVSSTSTRILSGEEEGVFEWITVNYLLGSFAGLFAFTLIFSIIILSYCLNATV